MVLNLGRNRQSILWTRYNKSILLVFGRIKCDEDSKKRNDSLWFEDHICCSKLFVRWDSGADLTGRCCIFASYKAFALGSPPWSLLTGRRCTRSFFLCLNVLPWIFMDCWLLLWYFLILSWNKALRTHIGMVIVCISKSTCDPIFMAGVGPIYAYNKGNHGLFLAT